MTSGAMNKPLQVYVGGIARATAIGLATIGAQVGITGRDLAGGLPPNECEGGHPR